MMTTEEKKMLDNYKKMIMAKQEENAKSLNELIERKMANARLFAALMDLLRQNNPDPEVANM
jgi:hypothetical protein